jgi:CRP/FNR family cyclic AMP-dependent transcriptional regulator
MLSRKDILETLLAHKWFDGLSRANIGKIAVVAIPRRYALGQLVHCKLEPAAGLYGILSGGVRISSMSAEGRESVSSFMGAGDWFGHIGLIDGLPRTHDIRAIQDSLILCLRHSDFRRLLEDNPILYKHFALKLCALIRIAFTTIEDRSLLSLESRLAKRLITLTDTYGVTHAEGVLINLHLPQKELASILNVTRQTVNKILAQWQGRRWIKIHYGQIVIVQRAELESLFTGG